MIQPHEKIKTLRILKGLSQEEMAEKLGYSLSGYKKIEHGETDLQWSVLEKIAKTLGMDLQHLLGANESNIFNIAKHFSNSGLTNCNILLSETKCAHELEKCQLLLNERNKEIDYLKDKIANLNEMVELLRNNLRKT